MSIKMMTTIMELKLHDATGKFVLLVLADHFNDSEGCAWPSINRIVDVTGISRPTVQRKLKYYEEKGLIIRQKRYNDSDVYCFDNTTIKRYHCDTGYHDDHFGVSPRYTNHYEPLNNKKGISKKTKLVDWEPDADDKRFAKKEGHEWSKIWQDIQDWNMVHDNTKAYLNCSQFYRNWCKREKPAKKQRGSYGIEANGASLGKKTITKEMWDEASEAIRNHWRLNRAPSEWKHHETV